MFKLASDFWSSKVTWTSILGVITAVSLYFQHQASLLETVVAVFGALQVAFVRDTLSRKLNRVA